MLNLDSGIDMKTVSEMLNDSLPAVSVFENRS